MALSNELIPELPNEISDQIISYLPFIDLCSGYFVSRYWQMYIDTTDELSKRLFRLSKRTRDAGPQAIDDSIHNLWQEVDVAVDKEAGDDAPLRASWDQLAVNPLFADWELIPGIDDYSTYEMPWKNAIRLELLSHLPEDPSRDHLSRDVEKFWRDMYVTYPPVIQFEIEIGSQQGSNHDELSGVKLGTVLDALEDAHTGNDRVKVLLTPERPSNILK